MRGDADELFEVGLGADELGAEIVGGGGGRRGVWTPLAEIAKERTH
jgi:hypothetical protein